MLEVDHLKERVEALVNVSCVPEHKEVDELKRLAEVTKEFLRKKAQRLLAAHRNDPIAYQYLSDGWATKVREQMHSSMDDWKVVTMGRRKLEFLERYHLIVPTSTGVEKATIVGDPRPLHKGRGIWNYFQARREFLELPRENGHLGMESSGYVFDGAIADYMRPKIEGLHRAFYDSHQDELGDEWEWLQRLDIVFVFLCVAHVCSKSLEW